MARKLTREQLEQRYYELEAKYLKLREMLRELYFAYDDLAETAERLGKLLDEDLKK